MPYLSFSVLSLPFLFPLFLTRPFCFRTPRPTLVPVLITWLSPVLARFLRVFDFRTRTLTSTMKNKRRCIV